MSDFTENISRIIDARTRLLEQLAVVVRSVIPLLLDHHLDNSAKPLSEIIFQIDANRDELLKLFEADPRGSLREMIDLLRKDRA